MQELWEDIKGFEGLYQINIFGDIRSYKYKKNRKLAKDKGGYMRIDLWKEGKGKNFTIHRLIAIQFIPNPENKSDVNHINGIRNDNRIENLEWVTKSENQLHSFRVLGRTILKGKKHGMYGKKNPNAYFLTKYKNGKS